MTDETVEHVARVKPLVWVDHPAADGPVLARAIVLFGTYFIVVDTDDFSGAYLEIVSHDDAKWWQSVQPTCEVLEDRFHGDDITPLKAAAQADYQRRILSALESAPMDVVLEDMPKTEVGDIGNYYGGLWIRCEEGVPQWSIQNWDGLYWEDCPTDVFVALRALATREGE